MSCADARGRSAVRKSALELTRKESRIQKAELVSARVQPSLPQAEAVKTTIMQKSVRREPEKEHSHDDGMSL